MIKRFIALSVLIISAAVYAQVPTWSAATLTGTSIPSVPNGWFRLVPDPVAGGVLVYASNGLSGIYSAAMWNCQLSGACVKIWDNGTTAENCQWNGGIVDSSSVASSRHPGGSIAVDTKRNEVVWVGGVCAAHRPGNPDDTVDMYRMTLNSTPSSDVVSQVFATGGPIDLGTNEDSIEYDSDHDALFYWGPNGGGHPRLWVYCDTRGNPGGTLSSVQLALNATGPTACVANTWTEVRVGSGDGGQPDLNYYPSMVYDTVNHLFVEIGQGTSAQIWTIDPVTKVFTQKTDSTCSTLAANTQLNAASGTMPIAFDPNRGVVFIHAPNPTAADWTYNAATDKCSQVQTGQGEAFVSSISAVETMTYQSNKLITWVKGSTQTSAQIMKVGALPALSVPPTITTSSLPGGTEGTAYSTTLAATGTTPITWSIASGSLPTGLSLNASTGVISGTPTVTGAFSFTVGAANGVSPNDSKALSITVTVTLSVPVTLQEAIYAGSTTGVARTDEPFSVGLPLAQSPCISNTSTLGLTGASSAQFRSLATWDGGSCIKWVLVDGVLASLSAGATASVTLIGTGSGNSGAGMATDGGSTITVATGGATFVVKKANFNVLDSVVVGATTVLATSSAATRGLVMVGPDPTATYPGNVTCSPETGGSTCATVYSSANDASSTCAIEEDGPVRTALKCTGSHKDGSGNAYMKFTARLYFYAGKKYVKVTSVLRNADYGASNTAATAYKGMKSYDLRLSPSISGTLTYTIANESGTPTSGTMSGTDNTLLYQGFDSSLLHSANTPPYELPTNASFPSGFTYTTDQGYAISKNGSSLRTGTTSQYPQGWADISNGSGVGLEIGIYQMAAYWPKSLEFNGGGADVRIGIWPASNTSNVYMPWSQWSIHDLFLNFHAAALSTPANDFLKFQHYLIGRAAYTYYNSTSALDYTMIDSTTEDNYHLNTASTAVGTGGFPTPLASNKACCIADLSANNSTTFPLSVYRYYNFADTGGGNQMDLHWSGVQNFWTRSMTGRYVDNIHWARMVAEKVFFQSDGFLWNAHPTETDQNGMPSALGSAQNNLLNYTTGPTCNFEHCHTYGQIETYFITGDETIKDALNAPKNLFDNAATVQAASATLNGGYGLSITRAVGVNLIWMARYSRYLKSIGDAEYTNVLANGTADFNRQVKNEICNRDTPATANGNTCTGWTGSPGTDVPSGVLNDPGISYTRGFHYASSYDPMCGISTDRAAKPFMNAIMIQGIIEFAKAKGTGWADYWRALDLAYGMARFNASEMYKDDGTGHYGVNGFRYAEMLDYPNNCAADDFENQLGNATTWMTHYALWLTDGGNAWQPKYKTQLRNIYYGLGSLASEMESYQESFITNLALNPGTKTLQAVTPSVVENAGCAAGQGSGHYCVTWTTPTSTDYLRVKYSPKTIVDWLNFDPSANTFGITPATNTAWFAATNATSIPDPVAGSQSMAINVGTGGLSASNFSVKAFAPTSAPPPSNVNYLGGRFTGIFK